MPGKIFLSTPGGGGTSYPYTPADVAGSTGPLTVLGGTLTGASTPFLNLSQTWNNAATTFTGALINVTDTASNAASLIQDWQVGGSSKLSVVKTGKILGNGANPYLFLDNSVGSQFGYGTGILTNGGSSLTWSAGGTEVQRVDNAGLVSVASGGGYQWSSTTASSGTKDLILLRDAAATLAQRNGTNAQSFRVYNTYTDASNYERGVFDWTTTANTLTVGTAAAGTGSSRNLALAGSSINIIANGAAGSAAIYSSGTAGCYIGVQQGAKSWTVTTSGHFVPSTASTYSLGQSGNEVLSLYLSKTITAAGTTGAQTINKATGSVNFAAAATSLVVTNSLVTTSSVIVATVGTNDATMKTVNAVASAGSFTLNANAAATAETRVNFVVLN